MAVLRYENVKALYGRALVVDDLSFDVQEGECFALLGPNGVGKTTSLNAMYGIADLGAGNILVDGTPIDLKKPHSAARLGASLVPQGRWIISTLTIEQNLLLGQASKRPGPWTLKKVYEMFPVLEERRASLGDQLSGGQQQMLAIGRSLMANPRVLLLDEPSEGLAPVVIDELGDSLERLKNEGTSMLLIEQRLELVEQLSDRYGVMAKGEIIAFGETATTSTESLREVIAV